MHVPSAAMDGIAERRTAPGRILHRVEFARLDAQASAQADRAVPRASHPRVQQLHHHAVRKPGLRPREVAGTDSFLGKEALCGRCVTKKPYERPKKSHSFPLFTEMCDRSCHHGEVLSAAKHGARHLHCWLQWQRDPKGQGEQAPADTAQPGAHRAQGYARARAVTCAATPAGVSLRGWGRERWDDGVAGDARREVEKEKLQRLL